MGNLIVRQEWRGGEDFREGWLWRSCGKERFAVDCEGKYRILDRCGSFAPPGLFLFSISTHGWRRGLHSFAASRLGFLRTLDAALKRRSST
jgi:hypothetical protein